MIITSFSFLGIKRGDYLFFLLYLPFGIIKIKVLRMEDKEKKAISRRHFLGLMGVGAAAAGAMTIKRLWQQKECYV